jgi:hypothetical protein
MSAAPWEVDAVLKPHRLMLLARLAMDTRNQAFAEASHDLGDTSWGIGCKAHERYVHAVARLAETTERAWLTVHRDGLAFTSIIDGVAIRAYRGPSDKPHARHVYAAQLELGRAQSRQLALPFFASASEPGPPPEPWAWLMAVETDLEGRALRVVYFQASEAGERRNAWVAPIGEDDETPSLFKSTEQAVVHARRARRDARAVAAPTGSA